MAIQFSVTVRNAMLDAIETSIGGSAVLQIWTGSPPATCATADTGSKLVEFSLDSDWWDAASSGSKAKSDTWSASASGTGTAGYFRLKASGDTTACQIQGTITATGGGGDMTIDNTSISSGQTVSIATFTMTENYS